ncbi:Pantothenate precursors transporter PanS [Saliniradius amylolyticus]|uniref:Pantothenates transporter PanS n=1 Tax=Saliniradius amylolyticus TaxID=2183582 RepID=A0A2S2E4K6_9ALTE|nr:bile acid:sodium symporter family protein [Saliniradius amylolyticus]AWL12180.1 Pantothenate precursors transporter PanS [Saliniradius amylolyticus]
MSQSSLLILNAILALMMFGIALSLKAEDFKRVVLKPKAPLTGILAQFLILPLMTWALTMVIPMPTQVALGLILVGSCPGGSFSNIMTYLARGNTAMSVSMTGIASLAAVGMTPFNFALYASLNPATAELLKQIAVPPQDILMVVVFVLAIPLSLGLLAGRWLPVFAQRSEGAFRFISLFTLLLFVLIALARNWSEFVAGASIFLLVVVFHNALALMVGWVTARGMKLNNADTRAVTLEVGLQNSGLGLGIIFTFFGSLTEMAIIAAAWGIWHLVSGLSLAWFWHRRDRQEQAQEAKA